MGQPAPPRILLISYPAQGHINPALHFATRLILAGAGAAQVTYVTTAFAHRRIAARPLPPGLSLSAFSDGYDDGFKPGDDVDRYNASFRSRGSRALRELISAGAEEGRPYTRLVYTLLLAWAADVAAELGTPATLLWIQPATVFNIYYHYFSGETLRDKIGLCKENPNSCPDTDIITFPGIPHGFTVSDLPSFLADSHGNIPYLRVFEEQFKLLINNNNDQKVLVNTFDSLEPEALIANNKPSLVAIGPLIPSAFSFRGDLYERSKDYSEWLSSKPKGSVIYVSFGSFSVLPKAQMEEIGRALLECGRPFLWVIREQDSHGNNKPMMLSCQEELERLGMIVPWSCQVEVLASPSLGCFVTHCGWNSTLESLACGAPVVALPQWTDQPTNAKLAADVWETGVRVRVRECCDGIVGREEIKRCLELVMGDESGEGFRRNAKRWKDLATEAAREGGTSDKNFKAFVDEMKLIKGGFIC